MRNVFPRIARPKLTHTPVGGWRPLRGGGRRSCDLLRCLARIQSFGGNVAIDELDHPDRGIVAVPEAGLHDAGITAMALLVARPQHLEQLLYHGDVADFRNRLAAGVEV